MAFRAPLCQRHHSCLWASSGFPYNSSDCFPYKHYQHKSTTLWTSCSIPDLWLCASSVSLRQSHNANLAPSSRSGAWLGNWQTLGQTLHRQLVIAVLTLSYFSPLCVVVLGNKVHMLSPCDRTLDCTKDHMFFGICYWGKCLICCTIAWACKPHISWWHQELQTAVSL